MKVGICHKQGSFSDTWIKYCQEHGISYQLVDAYRYDIIDQLKGYADGTSSFECSGKDGDSGFSGL